ncbi:hypothetical protein GOBAR_DD11022 [Gossypium barbadense]|nr:hypothetical protein GOBAR_DD11022 [Gossypium barbadense]
MPNYEQNFRLNWAALGYGEKRQEEGPDYTIFVGDLAADVSDYMLQETFKAVYPSVKSAKAPRVSYQALMCPILIRKHDCRI